MSTTYHWTGPSLGRAIGWARKADATAAARRVGGTVVRVDFGRLYGCQWIVIVGVGESRRVVAHDGSHHPARLGWGGQRNEIAAGRAVDAPPAAR